MTCVELQINSSEDKLPSFLIYKNQGQPFFVMMTVALRLYLANRPYLAVGYFLLLRSLFKESYSSCNYGLRLDIVKIYICPANISGKVEAFFSI